MTMVTVVSSGEKTKNNSGIEVLTLKGIIQITTICKFLHEFLRTKPGGLFFSGAEHTLQAATVAQTTLGVSYAIGMHPGLHYKKVFEEAFNSDYEDFEVEFNQIKARGNTILAGLSMDSKYVHRSRKQMTQAVIEIAWGGIDAIGFSHSPLASFAANVEFPYHIGTADAIIYEVCKDKIISSTHIKCPLK